MGRSRLDGVICATRKLHHWRNPVAPLSEKNTNTKPRGKPVLRYSHRPPASDTPIACETPPKKTLLQQRRHRQPDTAAIAFAPPRQDHPPKTSPKIGNAGECCGFGTVFKSIIPNRPRDYQAPFVFLGNKRERLSYPVPGSEPRGGESHPLFLPHERHCLLHTERSRDIPRQRTERTMQVSTKMNRAI